MTATLTSETLDRLLREAGSGPSPFDLQPWRFIVVRQATTLRRLQSAARNNPVVGRASAVVIVLGYLHPDRTHLDALLDARIERGDVGAAQAAEIRGRARAEMALLADRTLWAIRWAMTAAARLLLAAESAGVSAFVVDGFDSGAVRRIFGIPDDHALACLVALDATPGSTRSPRLELDETCFAEHFGQPWTG